MNIVFSNVKIYNVQDELDVVVGTSFIMEPLQDFPEGFEVATTRDHVLSIDKDDRTVTAVELGKSDIKFMTGNTVHKNIRINAVDATHVNATTLNGEIGPPQPK